MGKRRLGAVSACAIATALIAALLLIACGQRSLRMPGGVIGGNEQQHQGVSPSNGPIPGVLELDGSIYVNRAISAEGIVTSQGWDAYLNGQYGTNGSSGLNIEQTETSLTLRAFAPGEYAYGLYGQAIGADPKPLKTLINSDVCKIGGGRDDEIPLSYYVGIADYTVGAWRWFGPFGDEDVMVTVNSETLKSRFKSPSDNYYLAVLASNGSKAASALPDEGSLTFPIVVTERNASAEGDDPGGLTIEQVVTWTDVDLMTEPAILTGLTATAATDNVNLSWDANIDPNVDFYQVLRDDLDDADPPIALVGVFVPAVQYKDPSGMPGKAYLYLVQAHNAAGYGGAGEAEGGRLLIPPPVTATIDINEYIAISWTQSLGATGYRIYRADTVLDTPADIAEVDALTLVYHDAEPVVAQEKWYWVQALGEDFNSTLGTPASGVKMEPNVPPLADVQATEGEGPAPFNASFDATGSNDPDGTIVKYEWDWADDGTFDYDSGGDPTVTYEYAEAGRYTCRLRVTDNDGASGTATFIICADKWWSELACNGTSPRSKGFAFDPTGHPAILYIDSVGIQAFYAYFDGPGWSQSDADPENNILSGGTLDFDQNGFPAIGYTRGGATVRYSWFNGLIWQGEDVTGAAADWPCMQFDNNGVPYISYATSGYSLMLANKTTGWSSVPIGSDTGVTITWLAFDSNNLPGIAYYSDVAKTVRYAHYNGSSWDFKTIDTTLSQSNWPLLSLAFDGNDNPAISYYSVDAAELRCAWYNGSDWDGWTVDTADDVGKDSSIDFGPGNVPAIAYFDDTNDELKFAQYNGGSWDVSVVDNSGSVIYGQLNLLYAPDGRPSISYYQGGNRYAHYGPSLH